ncbi:MinD-like ATPase involved in chromosome partitioning or flagellar assembly [Homoserinimonas aerilata]|uniref:MinD-like ATPase involved in chromosome partitioning or flagellar assembly n=1 Tax=Homoserinimonas aerilata TaxID=1162970 RepID=A0A542YJ88_9MICO|nr:AAA family ATPase [Homoserinimonas aerilata]TQL48168.1 MinD-like ATPase involved in chromosome partitioning or flagellar assembly [Homoserinimonas aerilata]
MANRGDRADAAGRPSGSTRAVDAAHALDDDDDIAADEAAALTVSVDLPAPVRVAPEEELALSIPDEPISAGQLGLVDTSTMSIEFVGTDLEGSESIDDVDDPGVLDVVPLPASDERQSRRDRMRGEVSKSPESANMLTADRLIDNRKRRRPAPEGSWPAFVYAVTLHLVNLGDSPKVRARKEIDARIDKQFEGGTRFVPVLTRKGGVGKTTITALLGMALSDVREDRIIAIDANPDRGTLSERVNKQTRSTVRDIVTQAPSITSFNDFSTMVSRDETRLDILASDTDPMLSEAFDENDYNVVADLAARFYSIALTDCGTGIVHSVMRATLQRADSLVIVSGGSVDEARLASETLTWLEANGYAKLVRNAVVAINTATQGTSLVKLDEIESHFRSRVREIVRIPYDPQLAAGSVIDYKGLRDLTKDAARRLAAIVMDGLPARRSD